METAFERQTNKQTNITVFSLDRKKRGLSLSQRVESVCLSHFDTFFRNGLQRGSEVWAQTADWWYTGKNG